MICAYLAEDCKLSSTSVKAAVALFEDGATIPFIARYRKEKTGGLDETQLRELQKRYDYYQVLFSRKETILKSITEQGKLTAELQSQISRCRDKQALEDLYLPYKQRKKTKADVALEAGFGPVAEMLMKQVSAKTMSIPEGALHIVAQWVADNAGYRQWIRSFIARKGVLTTKVSSKEKTKFDMYKEFSERLQSAASHRLLAIRRGEKEKIVKWKIDVPDDEVIDYLSARVIKNPRFRYVSQLKLAIQDAYVRLLAPALKKECFGKKIEEAETASIGVFSKNFENLLMAAPAGEKAVLGLDPGYRTGCKLAVVDATGKYRESTVIYLKEKDKDVVAKLVQTYKIDFVAIGNGTGSKEALQFIRELDLTAVPVIVNEAGASVYSASEVAIQEYPDLDVTIRGAISIAHRLQDPLAELVKIDPKSIGVGQYQHDVNQVQLKDALGFTTEKVVNTIGTDVNTASMSLLTFISGIGPTLAGNIVAYRNKFGAFKTRKEFKKVPKLGPKAFEQCAGFLRIKNGTNPFDNTDIHPESYHLPDLVIKPSVDPRAEFDYAKFDDAIDDIKDLKEGLELEGVVTNVTNFGAFVDIGVHQDGLIHISKLSNTFVKNPHDVIAVGDKVSVTVSSVDLDLKRIQLARITWN